MISIRFSTRLGWKASSVVFDATVASDEVGAAARTRTSREAMALAGVTHPRAVAKVGDTPADLHEGSAARVASSSA